MKYQLLTALCFITLFACKKDNSEQMTLVNDCTGIYLRMDEKDYRVCNLEKVAGFADGEKLTVTFKKITECKGSASHVNVCMMIHENEGWIEVEEVK